MLNDQEIYFCDKLMDRTLLDSQGHIFIQHMYTNDWAYTTTITLTGTF